MVVSSFHHPQEFVIGCYGEYIKANNPVFHYFLSFTHTRPTTTTTMSDNETLLPTQSKSGIPTNIIQCTDLQEMARIVDEQNATDKDYLVMAEEWDDSLAFQAATALIFEAFKQPNGYTELILNRFRKAAKHRDRD